MSEVECSARVTISSRLRPSTRVDALGWQPHTVRGAFAGALKKKRGLTVTSEKVETGERVYRRPAEG